MNKIIPLLILFGCTTNQNYDKSLLPDADPMTLSKVNSKILVSCMQVPVPQPPTPINVSHEVTNNQMYDSNDCFDNKVAENETKKITLTTKGRQLIHSMGLTPKPMKRIKVTGNDASELIDKIFSELQ